MQPISGIPTSSPRVPPGVPELHTDTPGLVPAVRFEALDPELLKARYAANRPLIDAMLDPTTRPQEKVDIERDLGILPTALLQAAKDRGVHIYITRAGEKGPPLRLFHSNTDASSQAKAWDAWRANPSQGAAPGPQVNLDKTWAQVAQAHGASTPEQIQAYTNVASHANGGLPTSGKVYQPDLWFDGNLQLTGPAHQSLQELRQHYPNTDQEDGGFNAGFNTLFVYEKALPDPSPLAGHYRSVMHEFGHVAYYIIAATPEGQKMLSDLHQLDQTDGHEEQALQQEVAQDTVNEYGPNASEADYEKVDQGEEPAKSPFISCYAMESEAEHYAEGFESYWTEARHDGVPERPFTADGDRELKGRDTALWALIDHDMQLFQPPKTQNPLG